MKNLIITIGILLSTLSVKSQNVIGSVFNESFADSLIFAKINQVRVDSGLRKVYPSGKLRKFVSQKNSAIMVSQNRLFHPELLETREFVRQLAELGKEFSKINNNFKVVYGSDSIPAYSIDEIAVKINSQPKTYEELVEKCIDGWLNSSAHKGIMLTASYDGHHHMYVNLLCGVSIKKINNVYYGCVNYIQF